MKTRIGFILWVLVLQSCFLQSEDGGYEFPYQISNPIHTYELSQALDEISGISFVRQGLIACIQDEDGYVFLYDTDDEAIFRAVPFGKDGDYEGVTVVGNQLYVVKSNGNLFEIQNFGKDDQITTTYKTDLSAKNNVEGLTYDITNDRLLLICKDASGKGKNNKGIYSFDLKTKLLSEEPIHLIEKEALVEFGTPHYKVERKKKGFPFSPSGMAINPLDGNIYIIASSGNALLVLTPNFEIEYLTTLPKSVCHQPEGIAFDNQGNLYIASETNGKSAKIIVFEHQ